MPLHTRPGRSRPCRPSTLRRRARRGVLADAALVLPALLFPLSAAAQMGDHGHHAVAAAEEARVELRRDANSRTLLLDIGPVRLEPGAMRLTPAREVEIPVDGWLTGFEARVVDPDGSALPGESLHHINLVLPDRRELFLPIMQRLAAAGQETGRIAIPWPLGVPVRAGERLLVVALVHNATGSPREMRVEARLDYDAPAGPDRVDVQPFFLDIQPPPAVAAFDLPPGRSRWTWVGSPGVDARILALGGHIHEHGRELRLEEIAEDGSATVLWRTRPRMASDGRVAEVPRKTFLHRLGIPIRADRRYRLVVLYENPTGAVIPDGGMGEIGGIVVPQGSWPATDTAHADYLADYRFFTRFNPRLRDRFGAADADTDHRHP